MQVVPKRSPDCSFSIFPELLHTPAPTLKPGTTGSLTHSLSSRLQLRVLDRMSTVLLARRIRLRVMVPNDKEPPTWSSRNENQITASVSEALVGSRSGFHYKAESELSLERHQCFTLQEGERKKLVGMFSFSGLTVVQRRHPSR